MGKVDAGASLEKTDSGSVIDRRFTGDLFDSGWLRDNWCSVTPNSHVTYDDVCRSIARLRDSIGNDAWRKMQIDQINLCISRSNCAWQEMTTAVSIQVRIQINAAAWDNDVYLRSHWDRLTQDEHRAMTMSVSDENARRIRESQAHYTQSIETGMAEFAKHEARMGRHTASENAAWAREQRAAARAAAETGSPTE